MAKKNVKLATRNQAENENTPSPKATRLNSMMPMSLIIFFLKYTIMLSNLFHGPRDTLEEMRN